MFYHFGTEKVHGIKKIYIIGPLRIGQKYKKIFLLGNMPIIRGHTFGPCYHQLYVQIRGLHRTGHSAEEDRGAGDMNNAIAKNLI